MNEQATRAQQVASAHQKLKTNMSLVEFEQFLDGSVAAPEGERPDDWIALVNGDEPRDHLNDVRQSVVTNRPFGAPSWAVATALDLGLESTLHPRGRPRKKDVGCLFR